MKIENISDYLQGIRDFESYRDFHDLQKELKKEFPIGTKLKPIDGMETSFMDEGMEIIGGYDTSDPYSFTFKVKSKYVEKATVIVHRVEKIESVKE